MWGSGAVHEGSIKEMNLYLGDELHVSVLDAVVDHLHVVARANIAKVSCARSIVHLGEISTNVMFSHQHRALGGGLFQQGNYT